MSDETIKNHAAFIWSVADLLRGDYKQSEYGKVIMPLVVLRRLDCVLEPTKAKVLERHSKLKGSIDNIEPVLCSVSGEQFYNTSPLDFRKLLDDPSQIAGNLRAYIAGFSSGARDIIEKFDFDSQITKLDRANLLYLVVSKFADVDLHPQVVSNLEMGYLYEELIRRFSELSNETAGEHFTPREVIKLMVNLLFIEDADVLSKKGTVRTIFDPACGTGGMLSVAEDYLRHLNPQARLEVFGQELNEETYAICRSDMMLKGQDASHIALGNSFSEDGHQGRSFDYCLANPPFGVEWKKVEDIVKGEADKLGFRGRFGAGLPRINDGSFLFLQHMIAKMKPVEQGGSRIAVVFNGSPLFTGAAGSGESEIRRWIIENDWLEAVVALPDQLFYNTGISTYFWIVTNRKSEERRGKVQLVDGREFYIKMPKSFGEKRKKISDDQIEEVTRLYAGFTEGEKVKIFPNEAFGHMRITVEQPLRRRWEVNDDTIATLKATRAYARIVERGIDDLEPHEVDGAFDRIFARYRELEEIPSNIEAMRLPPTQETVESVLAQATIDTWNAMGWETTWDEVPNGIGAWAKALELKPTEVKGLIEALAVRDDAAPVIYAKKGQPEPDSELRDNENVPLPLIHVQWSADVAERLATIEYRTAIDNYVTAEVHPYAPDAWVDYDKTKIGYEIPLTRHFYKYVPPRALAKIDAEIKQLETEIQELLREVAE